ncbi:hypothetical protein [Spirosoma sp. KUDC1026]|nr:hypothetical protein HU175_21140 [Spirosoma sp. KUDC1026]
MLSDSWTITHDPYYVDVMGRAMRLILLLNN